MRITKRQLRRIIKEERIKLLREQPEIMDTGEFQDAYEWGDWPGRESSAVSQGWNYIEDEGPKTVRFDWSGGSMWYTEEALYGTVEGNVPPSLKKHLEQKGMQVTE